MAAQNYRKLAAWQRSMDLAQAVYELTLALPDAEKFGLTAQLRRAAVSVPSNIAEGEGRGSDGEFVHFLRIAHGSLQEIETQLILAVRFSFVSRAKAVGVMRTASEVGRILNGLIRSLHKAR